MPEPKCLPNVTHQLVTERLTDLRDATACQQSPWPPAARRQMTEPAGSHARGRASETAMVSELQHPAADRMNPHIARVYDRLLGGKDNYEADRRYADRLIRTCPELPRLARHNRNAMVRMIYTLARAGVRQFLDLGTGLPTSPNVHEVARQVAPESRVVYVDNDPFVLSHARALLKGAPGTTAYINASVEDPDKILSEAKEHLDFDQAIGVTALAVLHFVKDAQSPMRRLCDALTAGSYLGLSHALPKMDYVAERYRNTIGRGWPRTRQEIDALACGWRWLDPGLVDPAEWGAELEVEVPFGEVDATAGTGLALCGLARKPEPS